ncbi:MAG: membrane protein insertase YidC [Candidatus Marinimicrobia bacterium]|nr:membrane protein insertase YidC [Candidatus Neomarinimicrobiota bacterium]MCF7839332.1 membrane protein insertase YidC [Candidatus Neomarinimicrobiota bacterium]MCF7902186.1 membrane protein insertase YidC [Candidatus Neomarinimicrobiota bacterium]
MNDKNTVLAFVLMGLVLLVYFSTPYQKMINPNAGEPVPVDTSFSPRGAAPESRPVSAGPTGLEKTKIAPAPDNISSLPDTAFGFQGPVRVVVVYTPEFEIHLNSLGGGTLDKVYLNNYYLKDGSRVQIIPDNARGVLANQFIGFSTENFSTARINSELLNCQEDTCQLDAFSEPQAATFVLPLGQGAQITRTFTFYPDSFHVGLSQQTENLNNVNAGRFFATSWAGGIKSTEPNKKDELNYTKVYTLFGSESSPSDYDAKKDGTTETITGTTAWTGIRSKYFAALMVPGEPAYEIHQNRYLTPGEDGGKKTFNWDMRQKLDRNRTEQSFDYRVYLGPLDYSALKKYDLHFEEMMDWGWFGIIGKGALWLFKKLYSVIPNYGIVLIIFGILVKILLWPLTKTSFQSSRNMQSLQPAVAELKEKYKGDPKRLNAETMKLYKESGANPMGGCLPMLIQFPILIAMFNLFRSTIQLRDAAFKGLEFWIPDLSLPDTIAHVGGIPINILPIVMAVTMFLQQKLMSPAGGATNSQMKSMSYVMTFVFFFIFYNFPSGLNIYYALFNILSILQQKMMPAPAPAAIPAKTSPNKQVKRQNRKPRKRK